MNYVADGLSRYPIKRSEEKNKEVVKVFYDDSKPIGEVSSKLFPTLETELINQEKRILLSVSDRESERRLLGLGEFEVKILEKYKGEDRDSISNLPMLLLKEGHKIWMPLDCKEIILWCHVLSIRHVSNYIFMTLTLLISLTMII